MKQYLFLYILKILTYDNKQLLIQSYYFKIYIYNL